MKNPSENALVTKLKLMYSGRISNLGYNEILSFNDAAGVVNFLKGNPTYSRFFKDFPGKGFDVYDFKRVLNALNIFHLETILKYDILLSGEFHKYILTRTEIRYIITAILSIKQNSKKNFEVPNSFSVYSCIDLDKLAKAKTYFDVLSTLRGTKYFRILKNFISESSVKGVDFAGIEIALQNFLYDVCFDSFRSSENQGLIQCLKDYIDLKNFVLIYRMKKFYNLNTDFIVSHLLENGNLKKSDLRKILKSQDEDLISRFNEYKIVRKWLPSDKELIDNMPNEMRLKWCSTQIHGSFDAATVIFSYIILSEIELSNLMCIVQGKEARLESDEISRYMVRCK